MYVVHLVKSYVWCCFEVKCGRYLTVEYTELEFNDTIVLGGFLSVGGEFGHLQYFRDTLPLNY